MIYIIGLLLAFIVVREYQFMKVTQKLIDRIMSRNYYDYQVSKTIPEQMTQKEEAFKWQEPVEDHDLSVLNSQITL